jgi:signal transduction histidine kinase
LSAPFGDLQLAFALNRLEAGPGAMLARWTGVVLLAVLLLGFLALYRLGLGQLRLARQQQDFVAAVSHELKTPLTSIRMYGELLREGWVPEEKRKEYYAYIHDESERLSRLIGNILQLARMERQEMALERKPVPVSELFDLLRSRLSAQIERAGFEASFELDPGLDGRRVEVDNDALLQILINLVDNALKFSARAEYKAVVVAARAAGHGAAVFSVRDHGPGVPRAQSRRIFELFYRGGDARARETVGTGIGLALVRQLAVAMGGSVEVVNREPGAEFRVHLPLLDQVTSRRGRTSPSS